MIHRLVLAHQPISVKEKRMPRTKQPNRRQLEIHWEDDLHAWNQMPQAQRGLCRELLTQLLRTVVEAEVKVKEREESNERKDQSHTS